MHNEFADDRNVGLMTVPVKDLPPTPSLMAVANLQHKPAASIKARFLLLRMLNKALERHVIPVVDLSRRAPPWRRWSGTEEGRQEGRDREVEPLGGCLSALRALLFWQVCQREPRAMRSI